MKTIFVHWLGHVKDLILLMHGTTMKINSTEISGSIQGGEFTDSLSDYQLLKKRIWTMVYCYVLST